MGFWLYSSMDTNIISESYIEQRTLEACQSIIKTNKWSIEYYGMYNNLLGFRVFYNNESIIYFYHPESLQNIKLRIFNKLYIKNIVKMTCKLKKI